MTLFDQKTLQDFPVLPNNPLCPSHRNSNFMKSTIFSQQLWAQPKPDVSDLVSHTIPNFVILPNLLTAKNFRLLNFWDNDDDKFWSTSLCPRMKWMTRTDECCYGKCLDDSWRVQIEWQVKVTSKDDKYRSELKCLVTMGHRQDWWQTCAQQSVKSFSLSVPRR